MFEGIVFLSISFFQFKFVILSKSKYFQIFCRLVQLMQKPMYLCMYLSGILFTQGPVSRNSRYLSAYKIKYSNQNLEKNHADPTFMDRSLGTLLHLWGLFQFTQDPTSPPPHKLRWIRLSRMFLRWIQPSRIV